MSDWHVYRLFNEDDELLYVGCTSQPVSRRVAQHRKTQPWGALIASVRAQPYDDETSAKRAEMEAIDRESPPRNKRSGYVSVARELDEGAVREALRELMPHQFEMDDLYRALASPAGVSAGWSRQVGLVLRAMRRNGEPLEELARRTGVDQAVLDDWTVAS